MEVRLPASDDPGLPRLGIVAAGCLAVGLGLAFWAMDEAPEGGAPPASAGAPGDARPDEPARSPEPPAPDEARAPEPAPPPADAPPEEPVEDPAELAAEAPEEPAPEEPADVEPVAVAAAPPSGGPLRFVRGRVAYLRCDGVQQRGRCPRDEAMEDAVWAALAELPACATPPPAAGEADLRLAWQGDGAADVLWRDTFADDVVRLDRDRVLACLGDRLAAVRSSLGSERLYVSFRFALE